MNEIVMEHLSDGFSMMCIGMGTVLIFLCILILAMNIMSKAVAYLNTIFPEPVMEIAGNKSKKKTVSSDEEIAVAVLTAMLKK